VAESRAVERNRAVEKNQVEGVDIKGFFNRSATAIAFNHINRTSTEP